LQAQSPGRGGELAWAPKLTPEVSVQANKNVMSEEPNKAAGGSTRLKVNICAEPPRCLSRRMEEAHAPVRDDEEVLPLL
jgi:hypothetical protein